MATSLTARAAEWVKLEYLHAEHFLELVDVKEIHYNRQKDMKAHKLAVRTTRQLCRGCEPQTHVPLCGDP